MTDIIETRLPTYAFENMDEDTEYALKDVSKKFARDMRFDFAWEY